MCHWNHSRNFWYIEFRNDIFNFYCCNHVYSNWESNWYRRTCRVIISEVLLLLPKRSKSNSVQCVKLWNRVQTYIRLSLNMGSFRQGLRKCGLSTLNIWEYTFLLYLGKVYFMSFKAIYCIFHFNCFWLSNSLCPSPTDCSSQPFKGWLLFLKRISPPLFVEYLEVCQSYLVPFLL